MSQNVRKRIQDATQKRLKVSSIHMANSYLLVQNFYKPGGVMSTSQGDMVGRKIMEGRDSMGRWVYTIYAAKNDRIVTVVTAYQVFKSSNKTGTMMYHQQVVMLKQQNRTEDPRKACIMDLLKWIK
eukprot:7049328-Ditylum_brightwellii.AAC.1